MAVNKKALQQLRRVVLGIPAGKLDMSTYARAGDTDTPACIVAWATRDDWFAKKGFHLVECTRPPSGDDTEASYYSTPRYNGRSALDALKLLFGLSTASAQWLFGTPTGKQKPTPTSIMNKIDKLLADKPEDAPEPTAA